MLLVLPALFRIIDGKLYVEAQAANGLNRWGDYFSKVVAAAPVIPEEMALAEKNIAWQSADVISDRIELVPLPWAYSPKLFARKYFACRALLVRQVRRCEYLQFAIGGLWGDWAAVAATEARRQRRTYAIHTDRVESDVIRKLAQGQSGMRAWKCRVEAALMDRYHRFLINRCSVGLWHGQECFAAYSKWCQNNHLIHDVHTKKSDAISSSELEKKVQDLSDPSSPLKIAYAGRLSAMKAPLEWVRAIKRAHDLGIELQATWYGDGELRSDVERLIEELDLHGVIDLRGFVSDREQLLNGVREAHLVMFTHITPESPRCLLEALICGSPIVGYKNPFAEDLTHEFGGGSFVSIHDWQRLGELLVNLYKNRDELGQLVRKAAENGRRFNDDEVFRERSQFIKSATFIGT